VSAPKPVDFDALLDALGATDAEPPPLMKKLLADIRPAPGERISENARADLSAVDAAVLAELEGWLAALHAERRPISI